MCFFIVIFTDKVVRRMLYLPSMLLTRRGCGTVVDNLGLHEKLTKSTNLCVFLKVYE